MGDPVGLLLYCGSAVVLKESIAMSCSAEEEEKCVFKVPDCAPLMYPADQSLSCAQT